MTLQEFEPTPFELISDIELTCRSYLESLASDTKAFQEGDHLGNTFEHDGVVFMTGRLEEVMADNNSTRYVPALKVEGRAYGFHRFRYSSTTEVSTQLAREINIGMHIKNIDPSDYTELDIEELIAFRDAVHETIGWNGILATEFSQ